MAILINDVDEKLVLEQLECAVIIIVGEGIMALLLVLEVASLSEHRDWVGFHDSRYAGVFCP